MSERRKTAAGAASQVVSLQCSLGRDCSFSREGSWEIKSSVVLTPR